MKLMKRIRAGFDRLLVPRPGKNGSSMAFVMIVGAVLVIWVLAIMPLMVAVGNNSLNTQGSYADYLQSRSAIEFCKGELEKMVETKPPYTFCVVKNVAQDGSYTYAAIPKRENNSLTDGYAAVIAYDISNDNNDKPKEDDGKNVVAICAISQDTNAENVYHITVSTYNNGNKGLTYTADYTIRGSLLINPESYKQTQALPLSDFVLVDGKLGANEIWKSNIRELSFSNVTDLSKIVESLLPYDPTKLPGSGYADSSEYPAVFKVPVYPAGGAPDNDTPEPTEPDYTDDEWIAPNAVDQNKNNKKPGDIYFKIISKQYTYRENNRDRTGNKNTIRVYLQSDNTDITDNCTIYLNGKEFTAYVNKSNHGDNIPTTGIYQVSIDFDGYNKVLSADGLILGQIGEVSNHVGGQRNKPTNIGVTINGTTATLNQNTGAQYGYSTSNAPYNVTWSSNRTFNLEAGKTYFFFAYYPADTVDGVYMTASDVVYMGCAYSLEFVDKLTSGQEYLILGKSGTNYYAMRQEKNNSNSVSSQSVSEFYTGEANIDNNLLWTVGTYNGTYSFKNNRSNGKYLNLTGSYSKKWNFGFNLNSNACYFNVSSSNVGYVSKTFRSGNRSATSYIVYNNGFNYATNVSTSNRLYFAKVPTAPTAPDMDRITIPGNTVNLTSDSIVQGTALSSVISGNYDKLLANGAYVTSTLNAGKYEIAAEANGKVIPLGTLTVTKNSLSSHLQITAAANGETNTITVSTTGTHPLNGGELWIGYKGSGNAEYKWFPADNNNSYTFVLPYGTYAFVARESGTLNYDAAQSSSVTVSLTEPDAGEEDTGTPSMMMGSSLYFMGREGSINTEGNTIYLSTDLLVMRHDIIGDGAVYVNPYTNDQNTDETPADTLFFAVNRTTNASGFVFEACTFYRIPAGTDINHVTSSDFDLVNKPPLGLNNDADVDKLKILLRKGDYPDINMDIAYVDRENNTDKFNSNGTANNEQLSHIISGETIGWTSNGVMVSSNDRAGGSNHLFVVCAYVSKVNNVSIRRTANRILIAAEETDANGIKSYTMHVPNSLSLTCRYFSIHANSIIQSSNKGALKIVNLGKDESFLEAIQSWLGFTKYGSKSLQVDFETATDVSYSNGASNLFYHVSSGIYRLDDSNSNDGINLFGAYEAQPLMVTYTNSDLYNFVWGNIDWSNLNIFDIWDLITNLSNVSVDVVDRYINLTAGTMSDLEMVAYRDCVIEFYTNYIYIDNSVNSYKFSKWSNSGVADFIINSQERGYKSEYMGFFTHNSAETYNGTIVYIAPNGANNQNGSTQDGITVNGTFIPSGFYYIPACDGGTSIRELALLPNKTDHAYYYGDNPNDDTDVYRINPADLPKYSIYIKDDGTLSDAYVDTGLFGNSDLGESGFSGGNVG